YKAVWSKSGYFDGSKDYMADGVCRDEAGNPNPAYCPDSDLRFLIPMESTLAHTNKAVSRFVYDATANAFSVDSWLDRDGSSVPAVKEAKVEIFDPDSAAPNTRPATQPIRSGIAGVQTAAAAIQLDATAIKLDTTASKQDATALKQDTAAIKQATEVTVPGKLDALQSNVTAILEDTANKIPQLV